MIFDRKFVLYLTIFILTYLQSSVLVQCTKPTFAITAPRIIRPKADYNVIVSLHGVIEDTEVSCILERKQRKKNNITATSIKKKILTQDESIQIFKLQIDLEWAPGDYKLYVNATGGLKFEKAFEIKFVHKQFMMLIQSDKAIYKPGQTVLFRVLVLDDKLKPVENKDISDMKIYIIDPLGNKLRLFYIDSGELNYETDIYGQNRFTVTKGVSNDIAFTLHDSVSPGSWMIQASTRGQDSNYTFFVDYYQLPLANVTINLPSYISYSNQILEYKIDCFYTFGKPVKGIVKISLKKVSECEHLVNDGKNYSHASQEIIGQLSGKIDLSETKLTNPDCPNVRISFTADIKDSITNSNYTNFEVFDIFKQDLRAKKLTEQKKFKPGKVIRQHAQFYGLTGEGVGKKITEKINCETIIQTTAGNERNAIILNIFKDESNVLCDFKTDFESTLVLSKFSYEGDTILESRLPSYVGCSKSYVQVMLQQPLKPLIVGQNTVLVVTSNEPVKKIIYYIVVRGSIVNASSITYNEVYNEPKELIISLTRDMVPEAVVAVFFSSLNSSMILSDAITLKVSGLFHNEVIFNVTTPTVDASQKAKFTIEAEPESQLFLLAVDEEVLALKQGNDIIEKRVLTELQYSIESSDAATGFLQSGMFIETNAERECKSYYEGVEVEEEPDDGKNKNPDISIRKDFRETWIWDRVLIPHEKKKLTLASKVPDSITSWRVTAFAIHNEKGLGLTRLPGHVTVFRPFFIKLNVPHTLKRGEKSEIHILAFNYLNHSSEVDISVVLNDTNHNNDIELTDCLIKTQMKVNDIKNYTCFVTAHNVGKYGLLAKANAKSGGITVSDGEIRELIVLFEGIEKHRSMSVFFDFTKEQSKNIEDKVKVEYPKNAILGSQKVFASATAELITTTWKDSLKSMIGNRSVPQFDFSEPNACCQQRTVYYFPKVYWLDFLKYSKKATKDVIEFASKAIQKTIDLLCFQNPNDGSVVSWEWHTGETYNNNNVKQGVVKSSVWQTAYALKLMNHAKDYVRVDLLIIERTTNWLKKQMIPTGEFIEIDIEHQIINTKHFPAYLTSFVYIALNSSDIKEINPITEEYLAKLFPYLEDPYDIVITCYALHIANHALRDVCYDKVLKYSKFDEVSKTRYWLSLKNQEDLQITAYGLMLFVNRKSNTHALDIFRYLLSKQHSNGWFIEGYSVGNSLTLVLCTEAMTQFIKSLDSYDPKFENLFIDFTAEKNKQTIHLKPGNEILQAIELSKDSKEVLLNASGYGRAVARVYWQFNVEESSGEFFTNTLEKTKIKNDEYINLDICTKYNFEEKVKNVIMEIDLPSGYTLHKSELKNRSEFVDKIEPTNRDTHINIYLKEVTKNEVCVTIPAIQSFRVTNTKPVPLKVYPYYDRNQLTVGQFDVK